MKTIGRTLVNYTRRVVARDCPKRKLTLVIGATFLLIGVAYGATALEVWVGSSDHIGLWNGPSTLTARTLKTPIGETTGAWHYHPGFVYNVVRQGTITVEDGCGNVQSFSMGQAFETSQGNNERRCGPPNTVDECKGDGWASFNFPSQFVNQGQCVDFVNNRRRITLLVPEDPIR